MATLNTIEKVGRVLDLFTRDEPEWGVSEVATALGVPRSSAHAVLSSLVDIGLLQWRPGGRYRVGWRVLELAEVQRRTVDLRAAARPTLERLVAEHGETVHLGVRERYHLLYIDKFVGTRNITVQGASVGARVAPYCTSLGKMIIACGDPSELEEYLSVTTLNRFTPTTITDPVAFRAEIETIRRQGYAYDLGEANEDIFCVAGPIRDDLGQIVAAASMSCPQNRFERNRAGYTRAIVEACAQISRALVDARLGGADDTPDYPRVVGPRRLRSGSSGPG